MKNADLILSQYKDNSNLFPEVIIDFIKFANRKTSKLDNFPNLEVLEKVLNRRGTNSRELWAIFNLTEKEKIIEVKDDE